MAQIDPDALARLPKAYLEEDIGERLIIVAAVFIVLQTFLVSLYYISRYINKNLNSWECWILMPMSYILATAVCICSIRERSLHPQLQTF
jgi:hydrogenase-4 membrane subunit HyfE